MISNDFFVIMPAHNEERRISEALQQVSVYANNIIVVNDGSTDNTSEIVRNINPEIIILGHKINLGKGAAMKTGGEEAIKRGAKALIFIDADGQHSAEDMVKLADKLMDEKLDIVFGERKFNSHMPLIRKLGNLLLTRLIRLFTDVNLSDTQCGLRTMTVDAYKKIIWKEKNYSVETEMIINTGKCKLKYGRIGIQTIYKDSRKGISVFDGFIILINLFKWKLRSSFK
ncbi:MAG: glycosyltransferase family 2 protein [Candidatus Falkowbacteria bacterium]